jgi:hypothetical protein
MKNYSDAIRDRTSDLPARSAVTEPTAPQHGGIVYQQVLKMQNYEVQREVKRDMTKKNPLRRPR